MNIEQNLEITKLIGEWYGLIAGEGKDRDRQFSIQQWWSTDGISPLWIVEHDGYISDRYRSTHDNYDEAQRALAALLSRIIAEERESREDARYG